MKILITNDDGYSAKGIRTLASMMKAYGEVTVIGPERPQSGMSGALSLGVPSMAFREMGMVDGVVWNSFDATPASCTKLGLFRMLPDKPDAVVSGINLGSNASAASCYSGTLGAVMEAAINGIPGIGVSIDTHDEDADLSAVEALFPAIFEKLMKEGSRGSGIYYNVNFPDLPIECIKGVRMASQGIGRWIREYVCLGTDGSGQTLYKMTGEFEDSDLNGPRADHRLVRDGYISVVAHRVDCTDYCEMERLSGLVDTDFPAPEAKKDLSQK